MDWTLAFMTAMKVDLYVLPDEQINKSGGVMMDVDMTVDDTGKKHQVTGKDRAIANSNAIVYEQKLVAIALWPRKRMSRGRE